ncbi:Hypothetical protein NCS54_01258700 [Fusarium falciforme]|uniref:Hypothetical protein n=1 Tax=Fusarium falciforme TaxID=195108 RepID=UPI0022FFC7BA|nr:Hypothetical protein NCS54_01258700 [Fusarium falciforme]WAO94980.1 Hypothetical protein NCS54_01258700 [Fusarium falciforme]
MTSRFSYGVSGTCGYSGSYGYSYGALTSQQATHSREASRHSALSHPSYPPSVRSRKRTSTDEQHPRVEPSSHAHARESSAVGRKSSVEDEGTHGHRRRHNEVRHSEEARRRSIDHQKHCHHPHQAHLCVPDTHHLHHAHHTPHCHHLHQRYDPQTRQFQYSSSVPKDIKFPELVQSKVVAVKSKNNDMSWHRISQSMGLAKAREHDRLEEKIPSPTVIKVKKKKKWKWWWGKKKEKDPVEPEHHDVYNAPKTKEPEIMVRPESRPGMLEWLGGESLPAQSPQALKELFEREY